MLDTRSIAAMDPSEKKSLRLIEGFASCLRLNNFNDIPYYDLYNLQIYNFSHSEHKHLGRILPGETSEGNRARRNTYLPKRICRTSVCKIVSVVILTKMAEENIPQPSVPESAYS